MEKARGLEGARARHVPAGAVRVYYAQAKAVAYLYVLHGASCYALFKERAGRPFKHCSFTSATKRDEHLCALVNSLHTQQAKAEQARKERRAQEALPHGLQVGEVLCTSWGYEQTNVEFFKVIGLRDARTVELRELPQERTSTGDMRGTCVPLEGRGYGPVLRCRVRRNSEGAPLVRMDSYRLATRWNGQPCNWTSYA